MNDPCVNTHTAETSDYKAQQQQQQHTHTAESSDFKAQQQQHTQ